MVASLPLLKRVFIVLFTMAMAIFSACNSANKMKEKLSIAYVGRYSDKAATGPIDNRFDQMHEYMLKDYLKRMSLENDNYELTLIPFDCQRTPEGAKAVYEKIASDTTIVAIIDNTWGVHLAGATEIIKKASLPVIAINADHNYKAFGPQAIFTGNNDMLPAELSAYLKNGMNVKQLVFISEEDYALHQIYIQEFGIANLSVSKQFLVRNDALDREQAFDSLCSSIDKAFLENKSLTDFPLVINLHNEYGTKLLRYLDQHYENLTIIGHAYITQTIAAQVFGKNTKNELILVNSCRVSQGY